MSILTEINAEDFERQVDGGVVVVGGKYYIVVGREGENSIIIRDYNRESHEIEPDDIDVLCPDLSGNVQTPYWSIYFYQNRVRQFHRTASLEKYRKKIVRSELLDFVPPRYIEEALDMRYMELNPFKTLECLNTPYNPVEQAVENIASGKSISEAIDKRVSLGTSSTSDLWVMYGSTPVGYLIDGVVNLHPAAAHNKEYIQINCNLPVEVMDAS